jgi:hypothetical protein
VRSLPRFGQPWDVSQPKIDCHVHVLDPAVPYAADTHYRPAGQETGTAAQLRKS